MPTSESRQNYEDEQDENIRDIDLGKEGSLGVTLFYMRRDMNSMNSKLDNGLGAINKKLDEGYVTKTEFEPMKKIVYGMVTLVLITVFGAILALVITKANIIGTPAISTTQH